MCVCVRMYVHIYIYNTYIYICVYIYMYMYMCIVCNPYPIMFPSLPWHRPSHRAIDDPRDQAEAQTIRQGWDAKLVRGDGGGVGVLAPQHTWKIPGKMAWDPRKTMGKPWENHGKTAFKAEIVVDLAFWNGYSWEADERRQILGRPRNSPWISYWGQRNISQPHRKWLGVVCKLETRPKTLGRRGWLCDGCHLSRLIAQSVASWSWNSPPLKHLKQLKPAPPNPSPLRWDWELELPSLFRSSAPRAWHHPFQRP